MTAELHYNENELLCQLAAGDEAAFERIYQYYNRKVYYYVLSLVKSSQLAEDILQEIFLKIWESRGRLTAVRHFDAFLFTAARHHAINVLKSAARSQTVLGEILNHAPAPAFDHEILSRDYERFIQKALLSVPPRTRDIYRKCKEQGRTYEEVARELGISDNAVKRHVINSIKVLRQAAARDLGLPNNIITSLILLLLAFTAG